MPDGLPRLAGRIFNRPLMVTPDVVDAMLSSIGQRLLDGGKIDAESVRAEPVGQPRDNGPAFRFGGHMIGDGIAVLPVFGTLVQRSGYLDAMCGMVSYETIGDAVEAMMRESVVRAVVLEIDSSGGEVAGCFDCCDRIRALADEYGKPIWAHANEVACSAAYAIAAACDRITTTRVGMVGSIGVVTAHVDRSKADAIEGKAWTYIFSGDEKTDGNPHAPLSERARGGMQDKIERTYAIFVDHVAGRRDLSADDVRATRAHVYMGEEATSVGMIDGIETFDDCVTTLAGYIDEMSTMGVKVVRNANSGAQSKAVNMGAKTDAVATDGKTHLAGNTTMDSGAISTERGSADHVHAAAVAAVAEELGSSSPTDGAAAVERARCAGLAEVQGLAQRVGVSFDLAGAISAGMSVDEANKVVLRSAANAEGAETMTHTSIASSQPVGKSRREMWKKAMSRKAR
nr:S49 family peptidase [Breoghania sp.]